jgi:hypothetical protein
MTVSIPSATPEDPSVDVFELSDRTPLQALAGAYADRLVLIRSQAAAGDLADNTALIASLERLCLRHED